MVVDGTDDEEADVHGGIADGGEQIDVGGAEPEAGLEVGREGGKGEEGTREGHNHDTDRQGQVLDHVCGGDLHGHFWGNKCSLEDKGRDQRVCLFVFVCCVILGGNKNEKGGRAFGLIGCMLVRVECTSDLRRG